MSKEELIEEYRETIKKKGKHILDMKKIINDLRREVIALSPRVFNHYPKNKYEKLDVADYKKAHDKDLRALYNRCDIGIASKCPRCKQYSFKGTIINKRKVCKCNCCGYEIYIDYNEFKGKYEHCSV